MHLDHLGDFAAALGIRLSNTPINVSSRLAPVIWNLYKSHTPSFIGNCDAQISAVARTHKVESLRTHTSGRLLDGLGGELPLQSVCASLFLCLSGDSSAPTITQITFSMIFIKSICP